MKNSRRFALATALFLPLLPATVFAQQPAGTAAAAEPTKEAKEEASRRFQRGRELFNEGDYRTALVEFRRAYELAPNYIVLYNIGNVQFQLSDYAGALDSFEKYLAQGGANIDAKRKAEVDKDIDKLRSRVARVEIVVNVPDADVTINDQSVGKSPFGRAIVLNAGRHRITAFKEGRISASQTIDVASGDTPSVKLELAEKPLNQSPPPPPPPPPPPAVPPPPPPPPPPPARAVPWAGIGITAGFAVASGIAGGLAFAKQSELADLRKVDSGATKTDLRTASEATANRALVSDIFTGAAVVSGIVTIVLAVRTPSAATPDKPADAAPATGFVKDLKFDVSSSGILLRGKF